MTPEDFSWILANEFDSPIAPQFAPMISEAIRQQVFMYCGAVEEDLIDQPPFEPLETDPKHCNESTKMEDTFQGNGDSKHMELDGLSSEELKENAVLEVPKINEQDTGVSEQADALNKPQVLLKESQELSYGDIRIIIKVIQYSFLVGYTCRVLVLERSI